jgi:hypothetical protein
MANAGRGIGWTWRATRTPTATKKIIRDRSGPTGIGSSTPTISNLPFDEFAVDQLAGDLLPNATLADNVATGFLRNSMLNEEGGIDPEQFRNEGIIERMDVLGKAFLGLTVNCCQCHNHKYDPISQKEYYQLFAFLNNDDEPGLEVPDKAAQAKREDIKTKLPASTTNLWRNTDLAAKMEAWEKEMKAMEGTWTQLDPATYYASVGTNLPNGGQFLAGHRLQSQRF